MTRRLLAAGALACALPTAALAQTIAAPAGGSVPTTGLAFGAKGGAASFVSGSTPLPVTCVAGCSGGGGGGSAIPTGAVTSASVTVGTSWTQVWAGGSVKRLVAGAPHESAASCSLSFDASLAGATTTAGIAFASGAGGSFDFAGGAVPTSALYARCSSSTPITVWSFN